MLYFKAALEYVKHEVWKSDGTDTGTVKVDFIIGSNLTAANDVLYFFQSDSVWKSDGTEAGTTPIGTFGYNDVKISNNTAVGSSIYFVITLGKGEASRKELWMSDGTSLVKNIYSVPKSSTIFIHGELEGKALFSVDDGEKSSLLITDGTKTGTKVVKELYKF